MTYLRLGSQAYETARFAERVAARCLTWVKVEGAPGLADSLWDPDSRGSRVAALAEAVELGADLEVAKRASTAGLMRFVFENLSQRVDYGNVLGIAAALLRGN